MVSSYPTWRVSRAETVVQGLRESCCWKYRTWCRDESKKKSLSCDDTAYKGMQDVKGKLTNIKMKKQISMFIRLSYSPYCSDFWAQHDIVCVYERFYNRQDSHCCKGWSCSYIVNNGRIFSSADIKGNFLHSTYVKSIAIEYYHFN